VQGSNRDLREGHYWRDKVIMYKENLEKQDEFEELKDML